MFTKTHISLLILSVLLPTAISSSQTTEWTAGGANDNFSNPANWNNGVPGAADAARFDLSNQSYDVILDQDSFVASCSMADGLSTIRGPGRLSVNGLMRSSNHSATLTDQFCLDSTALRIGQLDGFAEWTITGSGTEIRSEVMLVGFFGSGEVNIKLGGRLITTERANLGASSQPGTVTISGIGSQWIADQLLVIGGANTTGVLNVLAGGELIGDEIEIASPSGGTDGVGTIIVSGLQSRLECTNCLIGGNALGTFRVSSGGQAFVSDLATIQSGSCLQVSGSADFQAGQITNRGVIELQTGAIGGEINNIDGGRIEIEALSVADVLGNLRHDGSEVFVSSSSQLLIFGDWTGTSDFTGTGTVDFEAGVRPGNATDATSTINFEGDVTFQSDAEVEIEFQGVLSSQRDQLHIEGDLDIDGSLSLQTIDGFQFSSEQEMTILSVDGNSTGMFDGLPEGAVVDTIDGFDLIISYVGGSGNDVTIRSQTIEEPCDAEIGIINGDLVIIGTQGPEDITVTESGGLLVVDYDQECLEEFPIQDVSRIVINSFGGVDLIVVDAAVPTLINAGFGADIVMGGSVENEIFGGPGADIICGGPMDDVINAGRGQDTVFALGGDDIVIGGDADDMLVGGPGNDEMFGGLGADTLNGNGGEDILIGNVGADTLNGGADDDELSGLGGPDVLLGSGGNDELRGGEGFDTLNGGPGTDTALDQGEVEISIEVG